jgi:hypothetical protein
MESYLMARPHTCTIWEVFGRGYCIVDAAGRVRTAARNVLVVWHKDGSRESPFSRP